MAQINNFFLASKDSPILWSLTRVQIIVMVAFSILPWILTFISFNFFQSLPGTIFFLILTVLLLIAWWLITDIQIDGRSVMRYMQDKKRKMVKYEQNVAQVPQEDINWLIESIANISTEKNLDVEK